MQDGSADPGCWTGGQIPVVDADFAEPPLLSLASKILLTQPWAPRRAEWTAENKTMEITLGCAKCTWELWGLRSSSASRPGGGGVGGLSFCFLPPRSSPSPTTLSPQLRRSSATSRRKSPRGLSPPVGLPKLSRRRWWRRWTPNQPRAVQVAVATDPDCSTHR